MFYVILIYKLIQILGVREVISTLCLLVSSTDNICKQSGSNLFDTLMVFLKEFSNGSTLKKSVEGKFF